MTESTELVAGLDALTVDELADIANREHRLAREEVDQSKGHLTEALIHGIASGKALLVVKERIPEEWAEWTATKLEFSQASAHRYCRWAYYEDKILAADVPLNAMSVVQFLRDDPPLPASTQGMARRKLVRTPAAEAEVKKLVAGGMTKAEVAEVTEISLSTVYAILNPAYDESRKRGHREAMRVKRQAERALKRETQRQAAKQVAGGRLDKAFSLIHQYRAEVDAAIPDIGEGREDLRLSLIAAQKATDQLNAAIRKMA